MTSSSVLKASLPPNYDDFEASEEVIKFEASEEIFAASRKLSDADFVNKYPPNLQCFAEMDSERFNNESCISKECVSRVGSSILSSVKTHARALSDVSIRFLSKSRVSNTDEKTRPSVDIKSTCKRLLLSLSFMISLCCILFLPPFSISVHAITIVGISLINLGIIILCKKSEQTPDTNGSSEPRSSITSEIGRTVKIRLLEKFDWE